MAMLVAMMKMHQHTIWMAHLLARLPTLKPRLQTIKCAVQLADDSWRVGKSSTQRGYGYKWQQARKRYLFLNPLCIYCDAEGKTTVAVVVDHIKPHKGDMLLFWDQNNWQSLCKYHHDSVKQREEKQNEN